MPERCTTRSCRARWSWWSARGGSVPRWPRARQLGAEVTIVDPQTVPLERVSSAQRSARCSATCTRRTGCTTSPAPRSSPSWATPRCERCAPAPATYPRRSSWWASAPSRRIQIARDAGLAVGDGIKVDQHLHTTHPHVYAAGDVAAAWSTRLQQRLRIEHWSNALNQGITAGHNLLGAEAVYDRTPSFFSDQYDLGMEYRGHAPTWDRVVFRGDPADGGFFAFWLVQDHVVAAMNVNAWDDSDALEALVQSSGTVDPAALTDPDVPLDSLIDHTTGRSPA